MPDALLTADAQILIDDARAGFFIDVDGVARTVAHTLRVCTLKTRLCAVVPDIVVVILYADTGQVRRGHAVVMQRACVHARHTASAHLVVDDENALASGNLDGKRKGFFRGRGGGTLGVFVEGDGILRTFCGARSAEDTLGFVNGPGLCFPVNGDRAHGTVLGAKTAVDTCV